MPSVFVLTCCVINSHRARAQELADRMRQEEEKQLELASRLAAVDSQSKAIEQEKMGLREKLEALQSQVRARFANTVPNILCSQFVGYTHLIVRQLLTGHEQAADEKARIEDQLRKTALKLKKEKKVKAKLREERAKAEEAKVRYMGCC